MFTSDMSSGQPKIVPQKIGEMDPRIHGRFDDAAIDGHSNLLWIEHVRSTYQGGFLQSTTQEHPAKVSPILSGIKCVTFAVEVIGRF